MSTTNDKKSDLVQCKETWHRHQHQHQNYATHGPQENPKTRPNSHVAQYAYEAIPDEIQAGVVCFPQYRNQDLIRFS